MFDVKKWKQEWAKTPKGKESLKRAQYKYNNSPHGRAKRQAFQHSLTRKLTQEKYSKSERGKIVYRRSQEKYRKTPHGKFVQARKAATYERKHEWEITENEYQKLMGLPCFYCGGPLPPSGCGLDRTNSAKEYTLDNVVPCCTICNKVKGDWWTPDETKIAVQAVINYRRNRGTSTNSLSEHPATNESKRL